MYGPNQIDPAPVDCVASHGSSIDWLINQLIGWLTGLIRFGELNRLNFSLCLSPWAINRAQTEKNMRFRFFVNEIFWDFEKFKPFQNSLSYVSVFNLYATLDSTHRKLWFVTACLLWPLGVCCLVDWTPATQRQREGSIDRSAAFPTVGIPFRYHVCKNRCCAKWTHFFRAHAACFIRDRSSVSCEFSDFNSDFNSDFDIVVVVACPEVSCVFATRAKNSRIISPWTLIPFYFPTSIFRFFGSNYEPGPSDCQWGRGESHSDCHHLTVGALRWTLPMAKSGKMATLMEAKEKGKAFRSLNFSMSNSVACVEKFTLPFRCTTFSSLTISKSLQSGWLLDCIFG